MDFTQVTVGSNSLKYGVLLLSTSASAVSFTRQKLTTPPLLLILLRREINLLSRSRSIGGHLHVSLGIAMTVASVLLFFFSARSLFSFARVFKPRLTNREIVLFSKMHPILSPVYLRCRETS